MTDSNTELNLDRSTFPIERYEPIKLIGKGALGEVYLARDKTLKRTVAVKCLLTVTAEQIVAFHREARIASRLSHPNVIGSFDFGTTDSGRPYLALEYFEGVSLEDLIENRKAISEELVTNIFLIVARALSYIHTHDICHRDLKPSNVLLKIDSHSDALKDARVIDFGLSSIKEEFQTATLTQGHTLVGTPFYMSPDQMNGDVYDARSEVYSLGCLIFEALTGLPPFPGESTLEILEHHRSTPPPLMSEVRPELQFSTGIQRIVLKCLAKAKEDRYQTMSELVDALEQKEALFETSVYNRDKRVTRWSGIAMIACCVLALASGAVLTIAALGEHPVEKSRKKPKASAKLGEKSPFAAFDKVEAPMNLIMQSEHVQGEKGVYFWGEESVQRLKALSESGKQKDSVTLRGMRVTGKEVDYLISVKPKLLQIYHCSMDADKVLPHLGRVQSIRVLGFHECTDLTPDSLTALKTIPGLDSIILEACNLSDEHLAAMSRLTQVEKFVLDGNENLTLDGVKRMARKDRALAVWVNAGPVSKSTREEIQALKEDERIVLITKKMESVVNRSRDSIFSEQEVE